MIHKHAAVPVPAVVAEAVVAVATNRAVEMMPQQPRLQPQPPPAVSKKIPDVVLPIPYPQREQSVYQTIESTMAISAQDVKTLRDRTGAGMGDCKKALEETAGDMDAAIEILRKKGAATASKRADKDANEGVVATATSDDRSSAAIVEVNCETDFVARNEEFSSFARSLAGHVLATKPASIEALLASDLNGVAVQTQLNDLLAKFNERIEIRRYEVVETSGGYVADYVHNGDKLGVLVEFGAANEGLNDVGRDVAMQVAAMNPGYVRREEVPADVLTKEREIYAEQMRNEGKPEAIIEKIVTGRLEKYYADNVLLEQSFVKDSAKAINEVIGGASIVRFIRFNLGQ